MKIIDSLQTLGRNTGVSNRRKLLVGAGITGIAGAAAVAVKTLPGALPGAGTTVGTTAAATAGVAKAAADTGGGYRLTAHVRRYYETTQA